MKKILFLITALLISSAIYAQEEITLPVTPQNVTITGPTQAKPDTSSQILTKNPSSYACPKCFTITKSGGKCKKDNIEKIQLGTYYCTRCLQPMGIHPGQCPKDKIETTSMNRKYVSKMRYGTDVPIPDKKGEQKN